MIQLLWPAEQKGSRGSGRSEPERRGGIGESSGNSSSSSKGKRANIICNGCGKKGYYKHECRSPRGRRKADRARIRPRSNAHGGNAPTNKTNPAKHAGGYSLVPYGIRRGRVSYE